MENAAAAKKARGDEKFQLAAIHRCRRAFFRIRKTCAQSTVRRRGGCWSPAPAPTSLFAFVPPSPLRALLFSHGARLFPSATEQGLEFPWQESLNLAAARPQKLDLCREATGITESGIYTLFSLRLGAGTRYLAVQPAAMSQK